MTPARCAAFLLALLLFASSAACQSDEDPEDTARSYEAGMVEFDEVNLQVRVPAALADLTYTVGEFEGKQPTLNFSTERLASAGGPECAAGAVGAVSPYPIGQVVVSTETPGQVRREANQNPEEDLGDFVKRVGDRYLYYIPPPPEDCTLGDRTAATMQQELTSELRGVLTDMRALRS